MYKIEEIENKIFCSDYLEFIKMIPDKCIDNFICDPPYGTNDDRGKTIKRGNNHTSFNVIKWDKQVPLDYFQELYRVMKEDTWGVIFTDNMFISHLWEKIEENGLKCRNTFYWIKNNKAPTPRANFKSNVETAIIFTKGLTNKKWKGGGNQNNYIIMSFVCGREKVNHPTQKPINLMKHFIKLFTNEGDIVLDIFLGSGASAIAAKHLGRRYIGCDINKEYCIGAENRLKQEVLL